jgi:hypothetical protein
MHPFTAFLAAEHLQDLLREAEDERLRKLAQSVRPTGRSGPRSPGPRALAFLRRRWQTLAGPAPVTTAESPVDGGSWLSDLDLRSGHRA